MGILELLYNCIQSLVIFVYFETACTKKSNLRKTACLSCFYMAREEKAKMPVSKKKKCLRRNKQK